MAEGKRSLTIPDLADRWETSVWTIRRMLARGELPFFPVGRTRRIPMTAIVEWETVRRACIGATGSN